MSRLRQLIGTWIIHLGLIVWAKDKNAIQELGAFLRLLAWSLSDD